MLLDTSALVEISTHKKTSRLFVHVKQQVGSEELFISIIQIAEVADWCLRNDLSVIEEMAAVREFAQVVSLDESICQEAARIKKKRRSGGHRDFGLIDAIILATARSVGQRVLTVDPHFSGEDDCIVLEL